MAAGREQKVQEKVQNSSFKTFIATLCVNDRYVNAG